MKSPWRRILFLYSSTILHSFGRRERGLRTGRLNAKCGFRPLWTVGERKEEDFKVIPLLLPVDIYHFYSSTNGQLNVQKGDWQCLECLFTLNAQRRGITITFIHSSPLRLRAELDHARFTIENILYVSTI